MSEQLSQTDFVNAMQEAYDRVERVLQSLTPAQMTATGVYPDSDWTVKDTLAHLTAWEQRTVGRLPGHVSVGDAITMQTGEDQDHYIERLNQAFYQEFRDIPLEDVLDNYHSAYDEIKSATLGLSPEEFGQERVYASIASNTFEHYQEHLDVINRWLARS